MKTFNDYLEALQSKRARLQHPAEKQIYMIIEKFFKDEDEDEDNIKEDILDNIIYIQNEINYVREGQQDDESTEDGADNFNSLSKVRDKAILIAIGELFDAYQVKNKNKAKEELKMLFTKHVKI